MGQTTIPGHRIFERTLTDTERSQLGDQGAINHLADHMRREFETFVDYAHAECGQGVTFHFVLTAQRKGTKG